jgi:hypothetical protein
MTREEQIKQAAYKHDDLGRPYVSHEFIEDANWADDQYLIEKTKLAIAIAFIEIFKEIGCLTCHREAKAERMLDMLNKK